MAMTALQYPDYIILAVFLAASLGIGLYHSFTGGRQRTTQEFIMANRRLGVVPTAISLFISYQSAIAILGATAEMYQFGAQFFLWEPIAVALATLLGERLIVPWIYPLKLMSINDVSIGSFIFSTEHIHVQLIIGWLFLLLGYLLSYVIDLAKKTKHASIILGIILVLSLATNKQTNKQT